MAIKGTQGLYTIAAVSKLTGVSCHTLRAWERRHGVPGPLRTASGHRRYDAEQVRLVGVIASMIATGHAVGETFEAVRTGRLQDVEPVTRAMPGESAPVARLLDVLLSCEVEQAERFYREHLAVLDPAVLVTAVIGPALTEIGERWFRGECAINQGHHASGFLMRKLHALSEASRRIEGRSSHLALIGAVQGDRHEGGVRIVCLLLELAGWRAIDLGADLPVSEFQDAIVRWRPQALGVSFVLSRNVNKRFQELSRIREVPVFVGGRSILNHQGLARRYGLIPLPGSAPVAIGTMMALAAGHRPPDTGHPEPSRRSPAR